jgi:hypothetical protein
MPLFGPSGKALCSAATSAQVLAALGLTLPGTTYTQTYSTAATTVPDATYAAPTVTVGSAIAAFTDPPSAAEMSTLRTFVNALKTDDASLVTQLVALAADVLAIKKVVTKIIDDLQATGIAA